MPVWGERRDYTLVHPRRATSSAVPLKANGVTIARGRSAQGRRRFPEAGEGARRSSGEAAEAADAKAARRAGATQPAATSRRRTSTRCSRRRASREFIDSAYFLQFKFEQGKYALVGRETVRRPRRAAHRVLPGAAVLARAGRSRSKPRQAEKKTEQRDEDVDATIERMMNKVSLVTHLGRAEGASDRQVHVRQRELRLPAGRLARARRTTSRPR